MVKVFITHRFQREAKRLPVLKRGLIEEKLMLFQKDPFDSILKTHKLNGKFEKFWSFSIDYRLRIIFKFDGKRQVIFHSIGNHSIYD